MSQFEIFAWGRGGGCEKYALALAEKLGAEARFLPAYEAEVKAELAVFIFPVYAQTLPKNAADCLKKLSPCGGRAFLVAVYGGVAAGDALFRAAKILEGRGFEIIGGEIAPAAHSYNALLDKKLFEGRPNETDIETLKNAILNRKTSKFSRKRNVFSRLPKRFLACLSVKRPIKTSACVNCGECSRACPSEKRCLRCFKCVNVCKFGGRRAKFSQPFAKRYLER